VSGYTSEANLQSQLLTWRDTMQPVYNEGIGVYPVRGNHERGTSYGTTTAWDHVFDGAYSLPQNGPTGEENLTWSVTHGTGSGRAIVLGLDQYYPNKDHTVPQDWVAASLAATDALHVFAMGHEPAFSSDHDDCLDDAPTARNTFLDSLVDAGGRSYFAGHDHYYTSSLSARLGHRCDPRATTAAIRARGPPRKTSMATARMILLPSRASTAIWSSRSMSWT
jgi:hypothetical protein